MTLYNVRYRNQTGTVLERSFDAMLLRTLFVISIESLGWHVIEEWVS